MKREAFESEEAEAVDHDGHRKLARQEETDRGEGPDAGCRQRDREDDDRAPETAAPQPCRLVERLHVTACRARDDE
jgi:hypothetical protein